MKNKYKILTIILLLGIIAFGITKIKPVIQRFRAGTVIVDGKTYKTSGAIPFEDTETRRLQEEAVNLANLGEITTDEFNISIDNSGVVNIIIYKPYDLSKQSAIKWLYDNNFELLIDGAVISNN